MNNLLTEYLLLKESEKNYTDEEIEILQQSILTRCNKKLKILASNFVNAIDNIND